MGTDNKQGTKANITTAYGNVVMSVTGPSCDFKWRPLVYQDKGLPVISGLGSWSPWFWVVGRETSESLLLFLSLPHTVGFLFPLPGLWVVLARVPGLSQHEAVPTGERAT